MQIFHKLEEIPDNFGRSIASVGNFDGVHRAHLRVLGEIVARARASAAKCVVVTFEPHPFRILRPDSGLKLLTPPPEKLRLLEQTGIDAVLLLPFNRDLSLLSPREFVQLVLSQGLKTTEVHEGFNFRFGNRAAGDVKLLTELGREFGFEVVVYSEMRVRGDTVSSSRIRELVRDGQVSKARALLSRPFSIWSTPGRGRGYGAKYTVPTINLTHYEELTPGNGVYVTRTRVADECFDSVTNVGNRPTFGTESFAIETHLLNFHPLELNAETPLEIVFLSRLRDEIKFASIEALRDQIGKDIRKARRYLRRANNKGKQAPTTI
jgi:riboflavin kinase/FMN adenylyltransferase